MAGSAHTRIHSTVDKYGFTLDLTADQVATLASCQTTEDKRTQRDWEYEISKNKIKIDLHSKAFKKRCRKGIPHNLRPWVWMQISGAEAARAAHPANFFTGLVAKLAAQPDHASLRQIDLDTHRTFPEHPYFRNPDGLTALRNTLMAFAALDPTIGYCQSMNYVAGVLLLVLDRDPEKAFWVLLMLVHRKLAPGTYDDQISGCHVEVRVLEGLLRKKLPALQQHLKKCQVDLLAIVPQWYLSLYTQSCPMETTVRIFDCLLLEGSKVLHRAALALFQLAEPHLMYATNTVDVSDTLKATTRALYDRDLLLRIATRRIGSLSMVKVFELREDGAASLGFAIPKRGTPPLPSGLNPQYIQMAGGTAPPTSTLKFSPMRSLRVQDESMHTGVGAAEESEGRKESWSAMRAAFRFSSQEVSEKHSDTEAPRAPPPRHLPPSLGDCSDDAAAAEDAGRRLGGSAGHRTADTFPRPSSNDAAGRLLFPPVEEQPLGSYRVPHGEGGRVGGLREHRFWGQDEHEDLHEDETDEDDDEGAITVEEIQEVRRAVSHSMRSMLSTGRSSGVSTADAGSQAPRSSGGCAVDHADIDVIVGATAGAELASYGHLSHTGLHAQDGLVRDDSCPQSDDRRALDNGQKYTKVVDASCRMHLASIGTAEFITCVEDLPVQDASSCEPSGKRSADTNSVRPGRHSAQSSGHVDSGSAEFGTGSLLDIVKDVRKGMGAGSSMASLDEEWYTTFASQNQCRRNSKGASNDMETANGLPIQNLNDAFSL